VNGDAAEKNGSPPPLGRHLKERAVKGTFWFLSGTAARALLRLVVMAILARLLVPEQFGLVAAAGVFVAFADLFATSGIGHAVVQYRDLEARHIRAAFTGNMAMALATAAAMWLLAGKFADFFRMPELEPMLKLLAFLYPIHGVGAISRRLLARDLAYGKLAAIEVASYAFGYALVALPLAFAGWGAWALIYAIMGSAVVRNVLSFAIAPHTLRPSAHKRSYRELMRNGFGFSLARWASFAAQKGDYFVVGRWLGAAPLGLYERAYVLMDLSNSLLTNALNTVLFPTFSRMQDDRALLAATFERVSAVLALIFLPAGAIASLLAPELIALLLGPGWDAAVDPFRVLALGMLFRTGFKVSGVLANGVGAPYHNALYHSIYGALVVGGALIALPFGITGVAVSTLVALAAAYVMLSNHSLKVTGMKWVQLLRTYVPALILTLLLGLICLLVAWPLRTADAPAIAVLAAVGLALGAFLLLLARIAPALFGPHAPWLASALVGLLKRSRAGKS
jgi:O-antigen/teichoic acid export membrane protein